MSQLKFAKLKNGYTDLKKPKGSKFFWAFETDVFVVGKMERIKAYINEEHIYLKLNNKATKPEGHKEYHVYAPSRAGIQHLTNAKVGVYIWDRHEMNFWTAKQFTKQCYGIYEHKLKSSVNMEETFQLTEDDLARVEGLIKSAEKMGQKTKTKNDARKKPKPVKEVPQQSQQHMMQGSSYEPSYELSQHKLSSQEPSISAGGSTSSASSGPGPSSAVKRPYEEPMDLRTFSLGFLKPQKPFVPLSNEEKVQQDLLILQYMEMVCANSHLNW